MEEQHQPKKKTLKMDKKEEDDRMSELQDGLLIDIISRVGSTKEAIRTGALSKRWQNLWPGVHNLIFSFFLDSLDKNWTRKLHFKYVSFVDKTLTQSRNLNLNKFHLNIPYYTSFDSQVNNCVRYAVTRNVQEFYFSLERTRLELEPEFVLSDDLFFSSSCFTRLRLGGCLIIPPGDVKWSRLTSLYISRTVFDEDLVPNVLSGCPLLETLGLVDCYGYRRLDITSKSVKNLVFRGYVSPGDGDECDDIIEIDAPYVLSLKIQSYLFMQKLLLLNVSSLVEAELNYTNTTTNSQENEEMFKDFMLKLRNVKGLTIGGDCQKLFTRLKAEGLIFPSNIKYVNRCGSSEEDEEDDWT